MKTAKIFQKLDYRSLIVGCLLSCLTGFLLFIVGQDEIISEIDQGLCFISGMTTIAALSAFKQYREDRYYTDFFDISTVNKQELNNQEEKLN